MSEYHETALRDMALQVIAAWRAYDQRYVYFMDCLSKRTGLDMEACRLLLARIAGY